MHFRFGLVVGLALVSIIGVSQPAFARATPESIARRIMDVCVEQRYREKIARDRIAPQCRCAAELATKRLGFGGISERPAPGQRLTSLQQGNLQAALGECQDAGLEDDDA